MTVSALYGILIQPALCLQIGSTMVDDCGSDFGPSVAKKFRKRARAGPQGSIEELLVVGSGCDGYTLVTTHKHGADLLRCAEPSEQSGRWCALPFARVSSSPEEAPRLHPGGSKIAPAPEQPDC